MVADTIVETVSSTISVLVVSPWFLTVKFIFLAVNLFFICFLVFAFLKTTWFNRLILWDIKEYLTYRHYGLPKTEKRWVKIKERLRVGTEPEAKLAIIEAGSLLDEILKNEKFLGKTVNERLEKMSSNIISNIESVREVNDVRLDIVHDPTYRLDLKEAERILDVYEKALVDLQAL